MINETKMRQVFLISGIVFGIALAVMAVLIVLKAVDGETTTNVAVREIKPSLLEERIKALSVRYGIPEENVKFGIDLEEKHKTVVISLPRGKLIEEAVALMFEAVFNTEYAIMESKHINRGRRYGGRGYARIVFESKRKTRERIVCEIIPTNEVLSQSAKIAFVIIGLDKLSKEKSDSLLAFPEPLNYVLRLWNINIDTIPPIFENLLSPIFLEIPMEDLEIPFARRKYTIIQSDNRRKMDQKIKMLLKMYPKAIGFYSRTGNLILNSREISTTFMQTVKKNNKAFFDARTSKNSVAREIADELDVKYDTATVFINGN